MPRWSLPVPGFLRLSATGRLYPAAFQFDRWFGFDQQIVADRHSWYCPLRVGLDIDEVHRVIFTGKAYRSARFAGPRGAADAMHIVLA